MTVCISAVTPCHVSASPAVPVGRFFVNLRCAESESSDVALHFNPRFDGWDKVVFNSYENESWGSEEKIRDMPFSKGQPFEMVIMVTSQGYQVSLTCSLNIVNNHCITFNKWFTTHYDAAGACLLTYSIYNTFPMKTFNLFEPFCLFTH